MIILKRSVINRTILRVYKKKNVSIKNLKKKEKNLSISINLILRNIIIKKSSQTFRLMCLTIFI